MGCVDHVNRTFNAAMDSCYVERKDERKGYTAEQTLEQDRILNRVIRGASSVEHPWALFTAGGPGSGKGTCIRFLRDKIRVIPGMTVVIDIDDLRMMLPVYQQMTDKVEAC